MSDPTAVSPAAPPAPLDAHARERWLLDPEIAFLNHGCFGARLREVAEAQESLRRQFEARPVEFLERRRDELLAGLRREVGSFLGMTPSRFGFVTNATEGVNAVLRSLPFAAGDEIVTTTHVYNAVRQTMVHVARAAGATPVEIDVPLPCDEPSLVTAAIAAGLTPRSRLLIVDHVTSPTALRLPLEAIVSLCAERGIDVLVDGAHAPGMLDLDVEAIGAAYYTGNLHKWVGAPPGAAFLWVRPDRQEGLHPTVISHFLNEGLAAELDWQGTRDITAWLAAGEAIRAMDGLFGPGSWPRIRAHNHALATWAQARLARAWAVVPNSPPDGSMLGAMAALTLPAEASRRFSSPDALTLHLYEEHRIEVPVFEWSGRWIIRPSCQVYNTPEQYELLADAVSRLLA